jgi:hypothetical protein
VISATRRVDLIRRYERQAMVFFAGAVILTGLLARTLRELRP